MQNSSLHTLLNGIPSYLTPQQIFDSSRFSDIKCVTFSADASFINKYLSDFSSLEILVGIQEDSVQEKTYDAVSKFAKDMHKQVVSCCKNENIDFFEELSGLNQQKCSNGNIQVYVPFGKTVHCKFYLLSSETECRVVFGSANLSSQAFLPTSAQYEAIEIKDNDWDYFNIYLSLYSEIRKDSLPYLSKQLIDLYKSKDFAIASEEGDECEVNPEQNRRLLSVHYSSSERQFLAEESVVNVYNHMNNMVKSGNLSDDIYVQVKEINDLAKQSELERKESERVGNAAYEVIRSFVTATKTPKPKGEKLVTKSVKAKLPTFEAKVYNTSDNVADKRMGTLYINPGERTEDTSGLYQLKGKDNVSHAFGQLASATDIKNGLLVINRWISNYQKYVKNADDEYCKRIMESILYAFASPFISEIRRNMGKSGKDVPQFLFIGGAAGSGKTEHLNFIIKLLGIQDGEALPYNNILPTGVNNKASNTVKCLECWLTKENNVAPIMIDEIDSAFFAPSHGATKGEDLIVNVTNFCTNDNSIAHPVLIGTTNAENYSLAERARRRSYYLKQDRVFDNRFRKQSLAALDKVLNDTSDILFRDFVMRFSKILMDDSIEWNQYSGKKKSAMVDFLYYTREIFKEYYRIAELELPAWFPLDRCDDSTKEGINLWKNLYLVHPECFKYDEEKGVYIVGLKQLDVSQLGRGEISFSLKCKKCIDERLLDKNNGASDFLNIYVLPFHKWIGVPCPYKKQEQKRKKPSSKSKETKRHNFSFKFLIK